jgi:hypothetical protein
MSLTILNSTTWTTDLPHIAWFLWKKQFSSSNDKAIW